MKKIITLITITLILLITSFNNLSAHYNSNQMKQNEQNGTVYYVDDEPGTGPNNPPEDFTSIQQAITVSNVGDTIYVYNGTYKEHIVIYKSIYLTGENKTNTLIDAQRKENTVWVVAPNVTITGFTIMSSRINGYSGGLHIRCKFVQISDCIIKDNDCGIRIQNTSNVTIDNCIISNNKASGIYSISASDIVIQHCEIFNNKNELGVYYICGIIISPSENDKTHSNIIIQDCNIYNNEYTGIYISNEQINVLGYRNILIQNNSISNHPDKGIFASECEVTILDNIIDGSGDGELYEGGISLQDINGLAVIKNNIISNSNQYGIYFLRSTNNVVECNDFYDNDKHISFMYQESIWSSKNQYKNNYYEGLRNPLFVIFSGWYINPEKMIIIPFMINIERNPSSEPNLS